MNGTNGTMNAANGVKSLLAVNSGRSCQESYFTASRDAGRRARQLRKLGYRVLVSGMGPQVTPVGVVNLTLVTILPGAHEDLTDLPSVERIRFNS